MKHFVKKLLSVALSSVLMLGMVPCCAHAEAVYSAATDIVRVGLYVDSVKSFSSANLQNVAGTANGYEFGYYNGREYVSLGASVTDVTKISIMKDRNMVYNSASGSYEDGSYGQVTVGCYHVRLETKYPDYASAMAAVGTFTSVNAFVRYENGGYYVLCGDYISSTAAATAGAGLSLRQGYSVDSGTAYTVTVVETGTDRILFEFDCGTEYSLAVRPISVDGEKPLSYFKNLQYYGDFVYGRNTGGNLTVINYVNIEDYVKGVVPSEMSASWPLEALKAGAVTARTYVLANLNGHRSMGFDVCNTTDCQVYYGRRNANENTDLAVEETAGEVLTYQGKLCETFYYASNGGASENSENVWGEALPYLRGVEDPYEAEIADSIPTYSWTVTMTGDEVAAKLRAKANIECSTIVKFEITQFTEMGNVYKITFTDKDGKSFSFTGEKCRTVLGLRSQRYTVGNQAPSTEAQLVYVNSGEETISGTLAGSYALGADGVVQLPGGEVYAITEDGQVETINGRIPGTGDSEGDVFVIHGSGYGHNVGMSQWGAYSMAKYFGKNYVDILTFYYTGTEVVNAYPNSEVTALPADPTTFTDVGQSPDQDAGETVDLVTDQSSNP